jgi:membrane peptidoglycan carboxypeptidase
MAGNDIIRPYSPPEPTGVVSPQAAYIVTDILAGNTDRRINPYWGEFAITDKDGNRRPATLKTGTNNDAKDLNVYGYVGAPTAEGRERGEYALVVGAWNGNSDNSFVSSPRRPLFSIDVTTHVWQGFMNQVTADWEIRGFERPEGIVEAEVDAWSGMVPGAFTNRTVTEIFIEGTVPRDRDTTKVSVGIEKESGLLWQAGCPGTQVQRGYLRFDGVEPNPQWQEWVDKWVARARRGTGVRGGPDDTQTSYFYNRQYRPYGNSWGAPFAPRQRCTVGPSPSPSPSPTPEGQTPTPGTPRPKPTPKPKPTATLPLPSP